MAIGEYIDGHNHNPSEDVPSIVETWGQLTKWKKSYAKEGV
jgi:hypothetical protein